MEGWHNISLSRHRQQHNRAIEKKHARNNKCLFQYGNDSPDSRQVQTEVGGVKSTQHGAAISRVTIMYYVEHGRQALMFVMGLINIANSN